MITLKEYDKLMDDVYKKQKSKKTKKTKNKSKKKDNYKTVLKFGFEYPPEMEAKFCIHGVLVNLCKRGC